MKAFALFLLVSATAHATCQSIYDPYNDEWVYECTPQPSDPRAPVCHQQYDPMNDKFVTVCN